MGLHSVVTVPASSRYLSDAGIPSVDKDDRLVFAARSLPERAPTPESDVGERDVFAAPTASVSGAHPVFKLGATLVDECLRGCLFCRRHRTFVIRKGA
ncbi:hypothetical protein MTO96_019158 [Rhipicephalus appendiculatus]